MKKILILFLMFFCTLPLFAMFKKGDEIPRADDNMIKVKGGKFKIRDSQVVDVLDFYISDHEVTQEEFYNIMNYNPSDFISPLLPVEQIDWYEAVEYCNKLSIAQSLSPCYEKGVNGDVACDWSKNGYRLPTEIEWEYAARGGNISKGYKFSGSDDIDSVCWYYINSFSTTRNVMTKSPNELGIYDMSGNVWEWCWDWFARDIKQFTQYGPEKGRLKVIKGGSWLNEKEDRCLPTYRGGEDIEGGANGIGFRIARSDLR